MRQKIALISVLLVVLLAGCAGLTTYEAPPAETDSELADDYGYEITEQEEISFEENVTAVGITQNIKMSTWLTIYEKDISDELRLQDDTQSPIVFATLNTPSINISDQQLNPLAHQSHNYLVELLSDETDDKVEVHDKVDEINTTHEITENNMNISVYEATFTIEELNATFDGYILISVIESDDSIILTFGSHPEVYDEEENIINMMKYTDSTGDVKRTEE